MRLTCPRVAYRAVSRIKLSYSRRSQTILNIHGVRARGIGEGHGRCDRWAGGGCAGGVKRMGMGRHGGFAQRNEFRSPFLG